MICAKRFRRSLVVSALIAPAIAFLGVACSAEPIEEEEETALSDQELQSGEPATSRDRCGNSSLMRVGLVGMCPKKSRWQWSKCYHTGTRSKGGQDVDGRLASDRAACQKAGGTYFCGARTTAYQPCSCCKVN